jgi:hypothetical protein
MSKCGNIQVVEPYAALRLVDIFTLLSVSYFGLTFLVFFLGFFFEIVTTIKKSCWNFKNFYCMVRV